MYHGTQPLLPQHDIQPRAGGQIGRMKPCNPGFGVIAIDACVLQQRTGQDAQARQQRWARSGDLASVVHEGRERFLECCLASQLLLYLQCLRCLRAEASCVQFRLFGALCLPRAPRKALALCRNPLLQCRPLRLHPCACTHATQNRLLEHFKLRSFVQGL